MRDTPDFTLLLVEDNPSDIDLVLEALRGRAVKPQICVVGNGDEALRFLRCQGEHAAAPRPRLIILDLNIPGMHGSAVLEEIKSDPALKGIPVIVFTSSHAESDIRQAYDLQASCFLTKPDDFNGYTRALRALEQFWVDHVSYPSI